MNVHLQILVRLASCRQTRLLLLVVSRGRVFVLFRRAVVRTSCMLRLFRIRRQVWLSS